jgi:hypothetical protein
MRASGLKWEQKEVGTEKPIGYNHLAVHPYAVVVKQEDIP